jgi:hypothetical protein
MDYKECKKKENYLKVENEEQELYGTLRSRTKDSIKEN